MKIDRAGLDACSQADGVVVVIDVLRAFSTSAYAFAAGADEILPVATVAEAFELRRRFPGALLMGEVDGLKIDGFDFGNSPDDFAGNELNGRRMIQRTGHGTQGLVLSRSAAHLYAASFVCARATVEAVLRLQPTRVTFVITGAGISPGGAAFTQGDEDAACADYLEALLRGEAPDPAPYLERVIQAPTANKFHDPEQVDFSPADLDRCTRLDRFGFAMPVVRAGGLLVMSRQTP